MTSNTRDSGDIIKILMLFKDFVSEYHHAKFGGNWTSNKGETWGQPIFYQNSPVWLNKTLVAPYLDDI